MSKPAGKIKLSTIILTYSSRQQIPGCLNSIYRYHSSEIKNGVFELFVVDNNSKDNTVAWLEENSARFPKLRLVTNKDNIGFGSGNNLGVSKSRGEYVLFLNPDTVIEKESISFPLDYISSHPDVGAVTAKTVLGNGQLDATCHRGFPTPWNSFCYFSGLTKFFPRSRLFAGYTLGYLNLDRPHEVDAINGAYFLMPRRLGQKLAWFDEKFFWKGEDLDLCYRIKEAGYKIVYLPQTKIWHYKGASAGHRPGSKTLAARFEVMRLFYDKHYKNKYPFFIRGLVLFGIKFRELLANLGI